MSPQVPGTHLVSLRVLILGVCPMFALGVCFTHCDKSPSNLRLGCLIEKEVISIFEVYSLLGPQTVLNLVEGVLNLDSRSGLWELLWP